jgi:hypothetical protein
VYARHEGVRTGRDFVFGHAEIARLLVRVGEGMSLRAASAELREHVLRQGPGGPSRQANLAVNYLDAYAEAVLAELHPTHWPRVVVLDATTLFSRGFRPTSDDPAEARTGSLPAGTILVALDGERRRPRPCLMAVASGQGRLVLASLLWPSRRRTGGRGGRPRPGHQPGRPRHLAQSDRDRLTPSCRGPDPGAGARRRDP